MARMLVQTTMTTALSRKFAVLALAAAMCAGAGRAAAQPTLDPNKRANTSDGDIRERLILDRVVAVVNDDIILQSELERRLAPLTFELDGIEDLRERARRRKMLEQQVLDEMIDEQVILDAADEAQLAVSEKEIDNAIDEIKRQNNVDDEGLAKALEMQGYTISQYRGDVKKQLMRMRAVNVMVRPRVTVTDEDVRAAYDARSRRSGAVEKVHLHHVLIALPEKPTQQQIAAAKARASEVIQRARAGEPFAALAAEYSDDTATATDGGSLGWIERGSIATEWEAIVFAMNAGEVRGPISGPSGLHVFHVSDLEKAEQKPFDEVKEQLRNDLYRREMDKQTQQWLEEQRKQAHVDMKI